MCASRRSRRATPSANSAGWKRDARGYQEGFSQGEQAGREQGAAAASAEQQAQAQRFTQLVDGFQTALESLDSVIPARLMQLALSAVRALLGKQVLCDTSLLLETIRQLMQENLRFTRHIELWVSQQDAALVSERLGEVLEAHGWTLRVDAQMTPGGCRLTAKEGELDATLATRWKMLCDLSREDDAP
ncbi:flagellar assembly protein FliH [Pantoea latae]|uniref:flagellar assembly protein FliH n=1 Tax=Pantoea latae TaxID=1964541 RepID=UPI002ED3C43C